MAGIPGDPVSFDINDAQKRIAATSGAAAADFETFQQTLKNSTAIIQGSTDATMPALVTQQKTVNDSLNTVTDAIAKQTKIASFPTFVGDVMGLFNDDWNWDVQNLRQRGAEAQTQNAITNSQLIQRMHENKLQSASKDVELAGKKLNAQREMIGIIGETFSTLSAGDRLKYSRMTFPELTQAAAGGDATARAMVTQDKLQMAHLRNAVISGDTAQLAYTMSALPDAGLEKLVGDQKIGGAAKQALEKRQETRALKEAAIAQKSDEATKRLISSLDLPALEFGIKQGETAGSSFYTISNDKGDKLNLPLPWMREALTKVQENVKKSNELRTDQAQAQVEAVTPILNGGAALARIYGTTDVNAWPPNVRNDWLKLNNQIEAAKGTDGLVKAAKEAGKTVEEIKKKQEGYRTAEGKAVIDDVFANGEVTDTNAAQGYAGQALVSPNFFYNNPDLHAILKPFQDKAIDLNRRQLGLDRVAKNPDGSLKIDPATLFESLKSKNISAQQMWGMISNTAIDKTDIDPATGKPMEGSSRKSYLSNELENYYGKKAFEAALYKLGTEDSYYMKFLMGQTGADGKTSPSGVRDKYTFGGKLDVDRVIKEMAYDQSKLREQGAEVDYLNTILTTLTNPNTKFVANITSHIKATADIKEQTLIQAMYAGRLESPIQTYVRGIQRIAEKHKVAQRDLARKDIAADEQRKSLTTSIISDQIPGVELQEGVVPAAPGAANIGGLKSQTLRRLPSVGTGPTQ